MPKDARYFPHDANARNDPRIKALIKKYKLEGYARYFIIIEMMREANNYKLEAKPYIYEAIADELRIEVEEAEVFIKDCINEFELFQNGDGFFYSLSLHRRMDKLDDLREKRAKAGYARHKMELPDDWK